MSQPTTAEVLASLRRRYATAGPEHKRKLLDQAVELLGSHRKAAIRALRHPSKPHSAPALILGRPCQYHPETLLPILKPIWFAAFQPCGRRRAVLRREWLAAYEADHGRLDADVRQSLLAASARTLDRLLAPWRVAGRRRGGTRPGRLLRQSIPIRGEWAEQGPGWLELDTVALCGGVLDGRHLWMLDAVDPAGQDTDWTEEWAFENRGQHCTLRQLQVVEESLPFALLGLDADNGGEFINHHVLAWTRQRSRPILLPRSRPYQKNDNAHVEQGNWTHVRQPFGYERYDNPAAVPLMNGLCKGPLGQLQNHFLPTHKLEMKVHRHGRVTRAYGQAQTPVARVLAAPQVASRNEGGIGSVACATQSVPVAPGHGAVEESNRSGPAAWGLEFKPPCQSNSSHPRTGRRRPDGHRGSACFVLNGPPSRVTPTFGATICCAFPAWVTLTFGALRSSLLPPTGWMRRPVRPSRSLLEVCLDSIKIAGRANEDGPPRNRWRR